MRLEELVDSFLTTTYNIDEDELDAAKRILTLMRLESPTKEITADDDDL